LADRVHGRYVFMPSTHRAGRVLGRFVSDLSPKLAATGSPVSYADDATVTAGNPNQLRGRFLASVLTAVSIALGVG